MTNIFITRLGWFRGPITKIDQSDCTKFAGPVFPKYWTMYQMITLEDLVVSVAPGPLVNILPVQFSHLITKIYVQYY